LKKELKRQIKEDEFISVLGRAWQWIAEHRKELQTVGLAAIAVLAIGAGLSWYQSGRDAAARADWAKVLGDFHAPLESELAEDAPAPAGPVFADTEERARKAMAGFDGFERRFPRHELALRARYYSGLCHIQLGELEQAEPLLSEVAARKDLGTVEPALALVALAGAYRAEGRYDDAVETWRRLLDDPASPLPKDQALMQLAENLERAERLPEARAHYERLTHEHPMSPHAAAARQRASDLERAG
jgi:tetratricopeptide (TPR) repeat protein